MPNIARHEYTVTRPLAENDLLGWGPIGDGIFAVDQSTSEKSAKKEGLLYYGQPDPLGFKQLKEAWDSRELLLGFFQRDLLIRYRQVFIGVL